MTARDASRPSIDLLNVDYDDVLQLYRGWRTAEAQLKDKNRELNALKVRIKQLQDSHTKFRGQIQALESVKELTVNLQNQLASSHEENNQLRNENAKLQETINNMKQKIHDVDIVQREQMHRVREAEVEAATLRGRYQELTVAQASLEALAAEEQASRISAESRLKSLEKSYEQSQVENAEYKRRIDSTNARMVQCDKELAHAAKQLATLSEEVSAIASMKEDLQHVSTERDVLKQDMKRLLRLFEHFPQAEMFLRSWRESDGMSYIADTANNTSTAEDEREMNYYEYQHLRNMLQVDNDPLPMAQTMQEELESWLPTETATVGYRFLASKLPHAPKDVINIFLKKMNKIWLHRENRKIQSVKEHYKAEINELKRKIANLKPYHGVMAERKIRRLHAQVKGIREKQLSGRPKPWSPDDSDDECIYEDIIDERPPWVTYGKSRYTHCSVCNSKLQQTALNVTAHSAKESKVKIEKVAAQELLNASLTSLGDMSRRAQRHMQPDFDLSSSPRQEQAQPTSEYLQGALWLGRNIVMIVEDMTDMIDTLRTKYLAEVSAASKDIDLARACQRLTLLAGSEITEVISIVYDTRNKCRKVLQGGVNILPGDAAALDNFVKSLPIETLLAHKNADISFSSQTKSASNTPTPRRRALETQFSFSKDYVSPMSSPIKQDD